MEINRLSQDELVYELQIRGVTTVTVVEEMRRTLRQLRKLEKSENFTWPDYPFTFKDDETALKAKLTELEGLVDKFTGGVDSSDFKKISTKLTHAVGRLNRSAPTTDNERKSRSTLLVSFLQLSSKLEGKTKPLVRSSTKIEILQTSGSGSAQTSNAAGSSSQPGSADELSDIEEGVEVSLPLAGVKSVPVMRWNLKYSGDNKVLSLSAFLERVEELMVARNVTKKQTFDSALDLFSGRALVWYRSVRKTLSNWDELVDALRAEFQPLDYDEQLYDEIRRRTQGSNESISLYISIMSNLFTRLSFVVPETNQLRIISRNLSPFYQSQLALADIQTLDELKALGRKLERCKAYVETYVPPPRRNQSLEPDLACVSSSSSLASVETTHKTALKCWNCGELGHLAIRCSRPPRKHCYKCGEPEVTVRNCPRCTLNSRRVR